jgi:hypothetical protein
MIWVIVALAIAVLLLALTLLKPRKPVLPLDPESVMQAAVELHRIRRDLDVAYTKCELRRDAGLLEHRIVEIIDSDDEEPEEAP